MKSLSLAYDTPACVLYIDKDNEQQLTNADTAYSPTPTPAPDPDPDMNAENRRLRFFTEITNKINVKRKAQSPECHWYLYQDQDDAKWGLQDIRAQ